MEKFIKKLSMLFVTFLCVTYLQAAYASDITSVIDYPKQNDMSDKFHQSSLMARCAGVVGAFAKFLPQSPASMKTVKENLFNHSMNMLTVSAMLLAEKKANFTRAGSAAGYEGIRYIRGSQLQTN